MESQETLSAALDDSDLRIAQEPYPLFAQINGNHSYKSAVRNGFVDYQVRTRHGGKIAFFNFELAKEMGLIPANHPHRLNAALIERLLDAFALVIINEWDIAHKRKFPKEDIKPNRYMATRYLQLQHPNKRGTTSGDGRGIWNGELRAKGVTWDISSSGTGATCLSPAVAIEKTYFRTGDPKVSYGNGYNTVDDGFNTAILSEIFHRNGIPTERTLVIIEFPGGYSINVRASRCLLRPSHFFNHLKQGNRESLKAAIDYFIERQVSNGDWQRKPSRLSPYEYFAEQMALSFSRLAALFESEYVFCWLDWDGDNILANAGIIDYGSIRQFGLFHSEYRYDDVDRFSTKLSEQRWKARYLVQTFAQIRSFLMTGRKRNLKKFRKDPLLKLFDQNYERCLDEFLLKRMGLESKDRATLMREHRKEVTAFRKVFAYFERAQSERGVIKVPDGVTSYAVFCMRDLLRELPRAYLKSGCLALDPHEFQQIMKSSFARKSDLALTSYRLQMIQEFQSSYLSLLSKVSRQPQGRIDRALLSITMRSSLINRSDRITGDGIIEATAQILRSRKSLTQTETQALVEHFVRTQILDPARPDAAAKPRARKPIRKALEKVCECVRERRESL